jgi:hypothetical protein
MVTTFYLSTYLHTNLSAYGSTVLSLDLSCFRSFLMLYTVGRTPWMGISLSQGRYLHSEQHKHRINAHTDIHALSGIRTHDPSFRAIDEVHASDSAVTKIGPLCFTPTYSTTVGIFLVGNRCNRRNFWPNAADEIIIF